MARVLQIRRGTAAQNDKFTGMPGELSFDTDAKTLRVHDGEMLGGYALMRADATNPGNAGAGNFDINSIPEEFWIAIVRKYAPAEFTVHTSREFLVSTSEYIECIFNTDARARFVQVALVCQTPQAGYVAGDECTAFGIGTYMSPLMNTWNVPNELHVRLAVGSQKFWVANKTTGVKTDITTDNWRIKFTVYC